MLRKSKKLPYICMISSKLPSLTNIFVLIRAGLIPMVLALDVLGFLMCFFGTY